MKYGGGGLDNIVFTELPFKRVFGDVTAFHKILLNSQNTIKQLNEK